MKLINLKFILTVLVFFIFAGCGKQYVIPKKLSQESLSWPFFRNTVNALGAETNSDFSGKLDIIWDRNVHDKLTGPMTLNYESVIYPGAKRKIKFYDSQTGDYQGRIKLKGFSQSGLATDGKIGITALAPPKNRILAIDLKNGKTLWKQPLSDAVGGSIIVNDRLLVSTSDGTVQALAMADGKMIWKYHCRSRLSAPAIYFQDLVYQTSDDGTVHALSLSDGSEVFKTDIGAPIVSSVVCDKLLYGGCITGKVFGLNPKTDEIIWTKDLSGPIWTSPAVTTDLIFIGHSGGELIALEAATGNMRWGFKTSSVIKASPIVVGEYVVFGTMSGKLFSLSIHDGNLIDQRNLKGAIAFAPITDGERVYVATQKGLLICLGENNAPISQSDYGNNP